MASRVDSCPSMAVSWESGTATLRPCQRIHANMSWAQESSGARPRTSIVSPLRSGGDCFDGDAPGREGKLNFVFQVVIPAEGLFFWPIGVHDGLVVDAFFADAVFAQFGHVAFGSKACWIVSTGGGSGIRVGVLAQHGFDTLV